MSSQKLPLFGGIIAPVHNGAPNATPTIAATRLLIASPPDKALEPRGCQAYYEIHLWLKPGNGEPSEPDPLADEIYKITALLDGSADYVPVWTGSWLETFAGVANAPPQKVLDGYPIRGGVSLYLEVDAPSLVAVDGYPTAVQVFGYYCPFGQGGLIQGERRYIGTPSEDADEVTQGVPLQLAGSVVETVHTFESNRIDELALAATLGPADAAAAATRMLTLLQQDANGADIIAGQEINISIASRPVADSVYLLNQIPLGGGLPLYGLQPLKYLKGSTADTLYVHGHFQRR